MLASSELTRYTTCFVDPITKSRILEENIIKELNQYKEPEIKLAVIIFVGVACIEKTIISTHQDSDIPNTVEITKPILDEVLSELNISNRIWRECHKYIAGTYKYVQIDLNDLMWFY